MYRVRSVWAVCQFDSARVQWSSEGDTLSKKIAEYAYAAVRGKPALHVNFIMDVSPDCDCWGHNDRPIVKISVSWPLQTPWLLTGQVLIW
jgi:uncharacterized Fe-S center protein